MAEDVTNLPKWAQRRIELLEMRLREALEEKTAAQQAAGYSEGEFGQVIIPENAHTVVFGYGKSGSSLGVFQVGYDSLARQLDVSTPDGWLYVSPRAANAIWVETRGER